MKRKIIAIVAFLAVMAAMTGAASAADAQLTSDAAGNNVLPPIIPGLNIPGDSVVVFYKAPTLIPDNVRADSAYTYSLTVVKNTPTGPQPSTDIQVTRLGSNIVGQTFKPSQLINSVDQNPITIQVLSSAPAGATYSVSIIATATTPFFDSSSATRGIKLINPNTTLKKTANPTSGQAPLTVTYTYEETNTGNVDLTNVFVTDDALTVTQVKQPAPNQAFNIGDLNRDNLLNPGETWTFTSTTTFTTPGTFTNIAHGHGNPIINGKVIDIDVTDPKFPGEKASATVTVTTGHPGKITGWGLIGTRDMSFQLWAYYGGLPDGKVEVTDNLKGIFIKNTKIYSVTTNFPAVPRKGTITGLADVTNIATGANIGNFAFTVDVEDNADPGANADKFFISLTNYPGGYTNQGGTLTKGDIQVVK